MNGSKFIELHENALGVGEFHWPLHKICVNTWPSCYGCKSRDHDQKQQQPQPAASNRANGLFITLLTPLSYRGGYTSTLVWLLLSLFHRSGSNCYYFFIRMRLNYDNISDFNRLLDNRQLYLVRLCPDRLNKSNSLLGRPNRLLLLGDLGRAAPDLIVC